MAISDANMALIRANEAVIRQAFNQALALVRENTTPTQALIEQRMTTDGGATDDMNISNSCGYLDLISEEIKT